MAIDPVKVLDNKSSVWTVSRQQNRVFRPVGQRGVFNSTKAANKTSAIDENF